MTNRQPAFLYCILLLFLAATARSKEITAKTETNQMVELTFKTGTNYNDPFNEVELDAVFTDPSGKELKVPAFWAGGDTWKVRYSSPLTGTHRFTTVCSNVGDKALHLVKGKVEVRKYRGDNVLFQRGAPKIATDKRHFAYGDGTPFFWMGDTWWMGLTKRLVWPAEVEMLAEDRIRKGFNVVQIIAGLYPDMPAFDPRGENENGFPWEAEYASIRPSYFDAADNRILYLAKKGIVPCVVGAWGYHLPWLGVEKMKKHWRYLIARWGALPVVWCAAGETTMPFYLSASKEADKAFLKKEWTTVMQYLKETDPFHRLLTTHAAYHDRTTRESITKPELLDFDMHQSGHGDVATKQAARALEGWRLQPPMPVMSGESRYEALAIPDPLPADAPRSAFWAHTVNSGLAGHTYGANGIWQLNGINKPYGKSPGGNNWGVTPWNEAMKLPGSAQIGAARQLIESIPGWSSFQPRPEMITEWSSADAAVLAVTDNNRSALAYLQSPGRITLTLPATNQAYKAFWFNPVTTTREQAFTVATDTSGKLAATSPPARQDWVLVLTKSD
ncbi:hypothetical protein GCM10023091_22130 [Ravibacter arvi]|uniref:DUF4038 domain-containing protein n=1 Tax=Ravibacter arvi TaxID=2051041 RepID=A0ABP8LXP2_9BACT